ncbi:unnamed protein product [Sphenostylis stenocarpa]|uniref:Protein kinase domain-containing protein n=1 Tax=Sphenostylis stenocarpa TaxID=92480 RepID=A0AA86SIK7_9FABA|nr:unnamed protein product [Sphenostylis stenocarpa]CAJ1941152.1 unnamed protein product [Sphenostylis stenocarpa]
MGGCLCCETKRSGNLGQSGSTPLTTGTKSESKSAKAFAFAEIASATKNFRRQLLLGRVGYGRMYKGQLSNGQDVVVKLLQENSIQRDQEFLDEVEMLSFLSHPNIVSIIGYCCERDQRLLVYEYMPLGSLDHLLHDLPLEREPLDWKTRMEIATGMAKALEYLHDWADQPVICGNLKSSKVLLDEHYNPKLSGVRLFGPLGDYVHGLRRGVGKSCASAPEFITTGYLTTKCDVYSFGVVLLELITGRKVVDYEMRHLVKWARPLFADRNQFDRLADPLLKGRFPKGGLYEAVAVAAMCLHEEPDRRPAMREVVTALQYLASRPNDYTRPRPPPSSSSSSPYPTAVDITCR